MTLNKQNKKISSALYLIGMSKNNIYKIMHENGIKVKRKDVRNYLDRNKMYAKTSDKSNYRERYKRALIQQKQGIIPDYKEEQKRLNKNYLVYVSIELLNKKKIKYSKEMKNIVGKVPNMGFVSP